ncbi:bifunctional endoribonuclease/protein kinase ire1 [Ascosphaera acerosa]|nr:bifunctional endoribonuclease/protein kinase ire1 [Ascosphaera acerosa]
MRWRLPVGVIALLPLIAAVAQQQHPPSRQGHHHPPIQSQSNQQQHVLLGGLRNSHAQIFRDTSIFSSGAADSSSSASSSDERALATLAPAPRSLKAAPAVGAPPARRTPVEGVANSQLHARSLQDWEVEDFVLLATVDGSLHALERRTGAPLWTIEVPTPMVETVYHRRNHSQNELHGRYDLDSDYDSEDDELLWIVEPSRDGDLYVYHQGPDGGLQKLGLTMKALVDNTPYSGLQPPVTYTARKETTIYTVDARTGSVLRVFSSLGPQALRNQCRVNTSALVLDEELDCDSQLGGTITIGRVEYTVAVQNTETGDAVCTLKFTEWTPNSRDADLQDQYTITMDKRHIYSQHDGLAISMDHGDPSGKRFVQQFDSPVARVFDVARHVSPDTSDESPLVILSQPLIPPDPDYTSNALETPYVYVNCTAQGGWYAMSEASYPLVTSRSHEARIYSHDFTTVGKPLLSLSFAQLRAALVGLHRLTDLGDIVPASPSQTHIAGLLAGPTASDAAPVGPSSPSLYPDIFETSAILRTTYDNRGDVIVVLISVLIGLFFWVNHAQLQGLLKRSLLLKDVGMNHAPTLRDQVVPDVQVSSQPAASVNSTVEVEAGDVLRGTSAGSTPPPTDSSLQALSATSHSPALTEATNITSPSPQAHSEAASPVPPTLATDARSLPAEQDAIALEEKPKKKAHRGRRGGQAHKRGKRAAKTQDSESIRSEGARSNASQTTLSAFPGHQLLGESFHEEIREADGGDRIGALKVYEKQVLGRGSHGTVVCKGVFDGRDVAVKRLLSDFYEVASHEVQLLQESDDHSNVIRYFCRERSSKFLYIALELCPANLQQIIERPSDYVDMFDIPSLSQAEMLRQITMGVRHLHSLKIVHRDIKPQNILVAAPKRLRTGALKPIRLLISDFGLCKRLEDNQSSFRATTANAAGTSGWRAPELLMDEDRSSGTLLPPAASTSMSSSFNQSDHTIIDPSTNRRATRAIDIFSLGCVFYYVLTRGGHPFDKDGKFLREANIVTGAYNLDGLGCLGDYAFEAEDLVSAMIHSNPRQRPDASSILVHPFFWTANDRLNFLCDVSDHFEFEPRDPPSAALQLLESVGPTVMGQERDFLRKLTCGFRDSLGKQRKYTGSRMLDLLRALRNKRNHYNDMPESIKAQIGGLPEGYLAYWSLRFPALLMQAHWVVCELGLQQTDRFRRYFTQPV